MNAASPISYSALLKQNKSFRNLFYALSISTLGDWFYSVALMGLVYSMTNSPLILSFIMLASALPRLLLSPFVGVFIDRYDKKKTMIVADIVRGSLIFILIPFSTNLTMLFVITVLNSIASIFFMPARQAVIPSLVDKQHLIIANSLSNVVYGLMGIIGASLGGALTALISHSVSFSINAISFFICAGIVFFTHIPRVETKKEESLSYMCQVKEGYTFILRSRIIFALVIVGLSWGIVAGAYQVLIIMYATDVFEAGDIGIGLLYATAGLGTLIGSWIVAKYYSTNMEKMKKVFGWAYLIQGVFFVFFVLMDQLWLGVIMLLVMRVAGGLITPIDSTLLQMYTPKEMLGRVFTFHTASYSSFMQVSTFLTGILLSSFSLLHVGLLFGVLCVVVSVYWLLAYYTNQLVEKEEVT
jgi:MFS family permease